MPDLFKLALHQEEVVAKEVVVAVGSPIDPVPDIGVDKVFNIVHE